MPINQIIRIEKGSGVMFQKMLDEVKAVMDENNREYYRILKLSNGKLTIIRLNHYREMNYDNNNFLKDKDGCIEEFDSEKEAIQFLKDNIKSKYIDDKYLHSVMDDNGYYK